MPRAVSLRVRGIWLALVVWALSFGFEADAFACDPADPFQQALRKNDLPSCAQLFVFETTSSPNITVRNNCDETLRVGSGCSGCEYAVITSSSSANVSLPAHTESEEPHRVDVPWELDGLTGTFVVETTFSQDAADSCLGGFPNCRCLGVRHPGQTWPLLFVLSLAVVFLRRRKT